MANSRSAAMLLSLLFLSCSSNESPDESPGGGGVPSTDSDAGDGKPGEGGAASDGAVLPNDLLEKVRIDARGFSFEARVAGAEDGEAVFLLHGFPQTSYEWRYLMPVLAAEGYRAIAPNQRGYSPGARPPNVEDYAIAELVLDVTAMADALDIQRFHVVGHDWGAAVAWGVAVIASDRVRSVVPVSVPHPDAFREVLSDPDSCQYSASSYFDTFSQEGFENTLVENDAEVLRSFFPNIEEEAVQDYVDVLGTPEAMGAALNWYRANVANRNISAPELGPVTIPTTYIWSDGDAALCRDGAELTADYVTGPYVFEVVEGVDHWVPERAPEQVAEAVLARIEG